MQVIEEAGLKYEQAAVDFDSASALLDEARGGHVAEAGDLAHLGHAEKALTSEDDWDDCSGDRSVVALRVRDDRRWKVRRGRGYGEGRAAGLHVHAIIQSG